MQSTSSIVEDIIINHNISTTIISNSELNAFAYKDFNIDTAFNSNSDLEAIMKKFALINEYLNTSSNLDINVKLAIKDAIKVLIKKKKNTVSNKDLKRYDKNIEELKNTIIIPTEDGSYHEIVHKENINNKGKNLSKILNELENINPIQPQSGIIKVRIK